MTLTLLLIVGLLAAPSAHALPPSPVPISAAQLTDSLRSDVDPLAHQVGSTELGAGVYSFPLWEPPARLSAGLSLHYSSRATAPDREMPRGWRIGGVPEVVRDRAHPGRFHYSGSFSAVLDLKSLPNTPVWTPAHVSTAAAGAIQIDFQPVDDRFRVRTADGETVWLDAMDAATASGSDRVTSRWRATRRKDAQGNRVEYMYDEGGRLIRVLSGGAENAAGQWGGFLCTDFHYGGRFFPPTAAAHGELEEFDESVWAIRVGRVGAVMQSPAPAPPPAATFDHDSAPQCIQVQFDGDESVTRCAVGGEEGAGDVHREGPEGETALGPPASGLAWLEPGEAPDGLAACWPFRDYELHRLWRPGHEELSDIIEYGYADPASPPTEREERVSFTYEDAEPDPFNSESDLPVGELGTTRQLGLRRQHDGAGANDAESVNFNPDYAFPWGSKTTTAMLDINGDARLDHVAADGEGWTVMFQRRAGDGIDLGPPVSIDGPPVPLEVQRPVFVGRTGTGFVGPWGEETCINDGVYTPSPTGDPAPPGWRGCMQHNLDARIVTTQDLNGDGYPDVIVGGWVDPMQHIDDYDYSGRGYATPEPGGFQLQVFYGNGHGFDPPRLERAPFRATRIVKRDRKMQDTSAEDFDFPDRATTRVDLRDWNGDGWLDFIASVPEDGEWRIWLHTGEVGGGWMPHLTPDIRFVPPWFPTLMANTMGTDGEDGPAERHFTGLAGDLVEWFNPRPEESLNWEWLGVPEFNDQRPGRVYGLTDLNGDGLLDFAVTAEVGELFTDLNLGGVWHVWLGNGVDFEPRRTWASALDRIEASNTEYDRHSLADDVNGRYGSSSLDFLAQTELKIQLVDVDGDGRLDQVVGNRGMESAQDGEEVWYRNLGDGFDLVGSEPPTWWWRRPGVVGSVDDVGRRIGSATQPQHAGGLVCGEGLEEFCGCSVFAAAGFLTRCDLAGVSGVGEIEGTSDRLWFEERSSETRSILRDVDGDGVLDALLVRFDGDDVQVRLGTHSVAHALKTVRRSEGLETSLTYGPGSALWPSGAQDAQGDIILDQKLPRPVHVVTETFTRDPVAAAEGTTSTTFEVGRRVDGVLLGFEDRRTAVRVPQHGWERVTATDEEYDLDQDLPPALISRTVWAPETWGPNTCGSFKGTEPDPFAGGWRLRDSFEYLDIDDGLDRRRLLRRIETTQRDPMGSTSRSSSTEIEWDEDWFQPVLTAFDPGTGLMDRVDTELGWTHRAGPPLSRLAERTVTGGKGPAEAIRWFYDGHPALYDPPDGGLPTRVEQDAGWLSAPTHEASDSDVLAWDMSYGPRGELLRIDQPNTGAWEETDWSFGAAVPVGRDDGLLPRSFAVDQRGRTFEVRDLANGVTNGTTFDGLDRPVATWVRDRTGVDHLLSTAVHLLDEPAGLTATTFYEYGAVADRVEWTIFDGRGDVAWSVTPGAEPGERIVTGGRVDLAGKTSQTFHPLSFGPLTPLVADPSLHDVAEERFFDGLGELRLSFADQHAGLAPTQICVPSVDTREVTDPSGFEERLIDDVRGRLVRVEQGGGVTAEYGWDPLARLVSFTSGEGNTYVFKHDLAGRLRRSTGPDFGWREFGYTGLQRDSMSDPMGSATWTHDAHGRPTTLEVTDPVEGLRTWRWTWDTDWVGALTELAGPAATTGRVYDDLGREIARGRAWQDGFGERLMTWDLDLAGRRVREDLLSGGEVSRRWTRGWLTEVTVDLPKLAPVIASLEYDEHGRRTAWTTSLGHEARFGFDGAGRFGEASMTFGSVEHRTAWQWLDNGLLQSSQRRVVTTGPSASTSVGTARQVGYDAMRRLTDLAVGSGPGSLAPSESFEYLDDGGLLGRVDPQGRELAYSTGLGAQAAAMVDLTGGDHEEYEYDSAGRLDLVLRLGAGTWSSYGYDGLGLLRTAMSSSGASTVFEQDPLGAPVQRVRAAADGSASTEYIFGGWRSEGGVETEAISPLGYVEDHRMRWVLRGAEGHAEAALDDGGAEVAHREYSAYGAPMADSGDPLDFDAFQGLDFDPAESLIHAGVRSFSPDDGHWLQPEPLLLTGLVGLDLTDPQRFSPYRYGRNTPTAQADPDGREAVAAAVGAYFGGLGGGLMEFGSQYYRNIAYGDSFDVGRIGARALQGAATGAVLGATNGASLSTQVAVGVLAGGGGEAAFGQLMDGRVDGEAVLTAATVGGAAPVAGAAGQALWSRLGAGVASEGAGLFDDAASVVTRRTRGGGMGVRVTRPDGSVIDITTGRVKEFVPNAHPNAPPGALQRVKFRSFQPGTKGFKREPTTQELDFLKSLGGQ